MNQDQVKEMLLRLEPDAGEFTVIFSGKESRKVNGLYRPERREIIIHNRNFKDDNALVYTAIHEFAHHIQHAHSPVPLATRAHTVRFWDILHRLLIRAEKIGIYHNIFKSDDRFRKLTATIRDEFLATNGELMKRLGELLMQAADLCSETGASFDDYVDRELLLHRTAAKIAMKVRAFDVPASIGYENMKIVAAIRDDEKRAIAQEAFLSGSTPDMVKASISKQDEFSDEMARLTRERDRIEQSIETLARKLEKIERRINEIKSAERRNRNRKRTDE